jgi:hypothetical protein
MADAKLTELAAAGSVATTDLLYVVTDPSGSPLSKKITVDNFQLSLTKVGKVTITQPATAATLTIANNKILTVSNTLTLTGTDGSSVAFGAGGTVIYNNTDVTSQVTAASDTASGKVELATIAETNTGTDATRSITPDGLAGSNFGIRYLSVVAFDYATDCATGDGKAYVVIPPAFNGMNLVSVHGRAITAGTTGTMDVQIRNVTQAADMLTTKLTWDSTEAGTDTAATPAVIDGNNDDVATNDLIAIDVDAVQTTAAKGMILTLGFQLP